MNDGSVKSAGANNNYQLGLNDNTNRNVFTSVSISDVKDVVSARETLLAVNDSGELYGWGHNQNGTLGNGGNTNVQAPTRLSLSNIHDFDCGQYSCGAVLSNGDAFFWGHNYFNQLGFSSGQQPVLNPTQVSVFGVNPVIELFGASAIVKTTSGQVYVMGNNAQGQLSTGSLSHVLTPIVNNNLDVSDEFYTYASGVSLIVKKSSGSWHGSGYNQQGNLGLNNNNSPISMLTPMFTSPM